MSEATPLESAAATLGIPGLALLVAVGAVTAMLGVLLNLILGLSRMTLAMGRRHDAPPVFGAIDGQAIIFRYTVAPGALMRP